MTSRLWDIGTRGMGPWGDGQDQGGVGCQGDVPGVEPGGDVQAQHGGVGHCEGGTHCQGDLPTKEGSAVKEMYQGWNPGEMYKLHMEAWDTVKVGPTVKEMYVIKEMSEFRGMNRF
jgi:hypothetical protein